MPDYQRMKVELVGMINSPEFQTSVNLQSHVITTLVGIKTYIPQGDWSAITDEIARVLGISQIRTSHLCLLPKPELRRALRRRPGPTGDLSPVPGIYPTEGWIGTYLYHHIHTEPPIGYHFWCGVVALSLVAGRNFYFDMGYGHSMLYLNHYVMVMGPTAVKKSSAIDAMIEILKGVNHALDNPPSQPGIQPPFRTPGRKRYISPKSATAEALLDDLTVESQAHGEAVGLIATGEMVTLLGSKKFAPERVVHDLTELYGGGDFQNKTSGGKNRIITKPCLNCLLGTTEDWLRTDITEAAFKGGWMGRNILVPRARGNRRLPRPIPIDPVLRMELIHRLVPWISVDVPIEMTLEDEAEEFYQDWYHDMHERGSPDPLMDGYWNRRHDHLHKLAGVLQLSSMVGTVDSGELLEETTRRGQVMVPLDRLRQALAILEDEEWRVPKIIAEVGATETYRLIQRIKSKLDHMYEMNGCEPVSHSRISRQTYRDLVGTGLTLSLVMDQLKEQGQVQIHKLPRSGRAYEPTNKEDPRV